MTDDTWRDLCDRLARSAFRSRFRLGSKEITYLEGKKSETIRAHARDFVERGLAPAEPERDGRQTPMHGHPVFVAQHATGTCCRGCLSKWHGIPKSRALSRDEVDYVVEVIQRWIAGHSNHAVRSGWRQEDLFGNPKPLAQALL